jgi:hypothetical protein
MKRLFIRSLQVELLNSLISKLHKHNIEVDILDNRKQYKNLNKSSKKIYLTKKIGDFNITNISIKTLIEIRKKKYDEIYIFHKQEDIYGFQNIIILCFLFDSKKIYHLKYDHNTLNLEDKIIISKKILIKYFIQNMVSFTLMPIFILIAFSFILISGLRFIKK